MLLLTVVLLLPVGPGEAARLRPGLTGQAPEGSDSLLRNPMLEMAELGQRWLTMSRSERRQVGQYYLAEPIGDNRKSDAARLLKADTPAGVVGNIIKTPNFRVIWGNSIGVTNHTVEIKTDADGDKIPSYIERLVGGSDQQPDSFSSFVDNYSGILEQSWSRIINEFGFTPPPFSDQYYIDVYIGNTGVYNSEVKSGATITIPHLGVASVYQNGAPYIILHHDMGANTLRATAAHEFFHTVQMGYLNYYQMTGDPLVLWLAESTATWIEDAVFPLANIYVNDIASLTGTPYRSLFYEYDLIPYGAVLFQKYLSENYHAPDDPYGAGVIRALWEQTAVAKQAGGSVPEALESFLAAQSFGPHHNLADAYVDFALKNLDMAAHYQEGHLYKPLAPPTKMLWPGVTMSGNLTYQPFHYGSSYLKLNLQDDGLGPLANRLRALFVAEDYGPEWRFHVVPVRADGTLGAPEPVDLAADSAGWQFFKEDNELYRAAYLVASALPGPGQALSTSKSYPCQYQVDAYVGTRLARGWNLVEVPPGGLEAFGEDLGQITSAWRWSEGEDGEFTWQVEFPGGNPAVLEAYVQAKGFFKLSDFGAGDGGWLNAAADGVEVDFANAVAGQTLSLEPGWNLRGSRVLAPVPVSELAAASPVKSIWKWEAVRGQWLMFTPALSAAELAAYVAEKGFGLLNNINYGDGFWLDSEGTVVLSLGP